MIQMAKNNMLNIDSDKSEESEYYDEENDETPKLKESIKNESELEIIELEEKKPYFIVNIMNDVIPKQSEE